MLCGTQTLSSISQTSPHSVILCAPRTTLAFGRVNVTQVGKDPGINESTSRVFLSSTQTVPIYPPHNLARVPLSLFLSLFLFHLHSIQKPSKHVNEVLRCIHMRRRFEFCLKSVKEGVGSVPIPEKWEELGEGLCSSLNCWRRDSKSYGNRA